MIWIFATAVLGLFMFHPTFRKVTLIAGAIALLLLIVAVARADVPFATNLLPQYQSPQLMQIGRYAGYVIVGEKTVIGYQDSNGKRENSFEGCVYGRKIIFDDSTYLTCSGYQYQYAYRPVATLLVRNGSWKMIVDGNEYDMRN